MKALLAALSICLLACAEPARAQSMPAVYLNSRDEATVPDSATHYRVIDRKNELLGTYAMREFSLTGTLLLRGTLSSIDPIVRTGLLTWYHPNGAKAAQVHYRTDEAEGVYVAWDEDGHVRQRGEYLNGQRTGTWISVHRNGQKRSKGTYAAGRAVGEWRYYYDTGQLSALELLGRDKGPALAFFNEDGSPYVGKLQKRELPQFPGGEGALLSYVARNTDYPRNSRRKGITGKVYVRYTVDEQGRVGQVQVVQGLSPETDQEARRVVASLPAFRPGREYNVPTAMTFTVPIHFSPSFSLFNGTRPPQVPPTEARAARPEEMY
ncbi:energy transducer TonB [Hymenobacter sp. APR13]|uniref:energy transducer TonB n=1 Tax=Hymenobacter sp. APR13 TaxID=1356852 RepID=UPI0009E0421B|nr:energy transducer TonB [Hymenobacter sp. APR13]